MDTNKSQFWNKAMFWGFIIALVSMIQITIHYSTDNFFSPSKGYIDMAIYAIGIVACGILYKSTLEENTPFPYSRALGLGVATAFFASLILALFNFILYKFIDSNLITETLIMAEEQLLKSGLSDDMIEQQIELQSKFVTPAIISVSAVFSSVITGLVISLITSIFVLKKSTNGFDAAMSEIED